MKYLSASDLTGRRRAVLEVIRKSYQERGVGPSLREIVAGTDITSVSVANNYLVALEALGFIVLGEDYSQRRARLVSVCNLCYENEISGDCRICDECLDREIEARERGDGWF